MVLLNINLDQNLTQHLNILSLDMIITLWNIMTVHLDMDHVRILINQAAKTDATIKKEQKLIQAQNLVREFEKTHTVSAHRKAQKAVNLVSFEYNVKKMILQERIDEVLKQGLVR
ncbi:Extracellular fibrinogen-binding protein Efb [Staphylococcus aureus]|nr:Extracellular fibrinogen-binding protein Efb [Staphylococcus aureus]